MSGYISKAKPAQFRLPLWVAEFVEERSKTLGRTKTEIIVEAVSCLKARETQDLMREGYREMSGLNVEMAEEGIASSAEVPEW